MIPEIGRRQLLAALACSPVVMRAQQNTAVTDQHAALDLKTKQVAFRHTNHPDAQWFGQAGLGLFVHWGISSAHGGLDLSWGMMANKPWDPKGKRPESLCTPNEYFALAKRLRADHFEPHRFLKAARDAGFRYAVMTTRHHDGFAMWPSDAGEFGVKQYLPGVDLVKQFAEGCRANNLKVGFYYSPPDWYFNRQYMSFNYGSKDQKRFPGRPHFGLDHQPIPEIPAEPPEHKQAYVAYLRRQITELLTRYGRVDVLWFDGGPNVIEIDEIRSMQPAIVINPRMHGYGDFATPEMKMPEKAPEGWWELCAIWAGSWGYNKSHENYRSAGWMLQNLTHVRSWGGNLLINVGPRADGSLPDSYYARMNEVAGWMKHSSVSVFGVNRGPYPQRCNVPVTTRENTWWVHLAPEFKGTVTITDVSSPHRITALRTAAAIPFEWKDRVLTIQAPAGQRTNLVDVLSIEWRPEK